MAGLILAWLEVGFLGSDGIQAERAGPRAALVLASAAARSAAPKGVAAVGALVQALVSRSLSADGQLSGPPAPNRIQIPHIGVSASVVTLPASSEGAIPVPSDAELAGWYSGGPSPGDPGPAVVVGHLDSEHGPAIFWRLAELRPGDAIIVGRAEGTTPQFVVRRVAGYPRSTFPSDEVYGATVAPELRMITCGGFFNPLTRQYFDNVVVFAAEGSG